METMYNRELLVIYCGQSQVMAVTSLKSCTLRSQDQALCHYTKQTSNTMLNLHFGEESFANTSNKNTFCYKILWQQCRHRILPKRKLVNLTKSIQLLETPLPILAVLSAFFLCFIWNNFCTTRSMF